jgi:hypothetical protein
MALLQGIKKLFGPLLDDQDCISAVKEAFAGSSLHVMAMLQGIKKLVGLLLDDLDCVSAVKEAMELQVEACMKEEDRGWQLLHTGTFSQGKDILKAKRASLADETFEMLMFMRGNKLHLMIFLRIF